MSNSRVLAVMLALAGVVILLLALINWVAVKLLNASDRPYPSPRRLAGNFCRAIRLAWRGQSSARAVPGQRPRSAMSGTKFSR